MAKINSAMKTLSKGDNLKEEMALIVGPNASWEDFLTPAPMCISLLGQLMVISTRADFSLELTPPKDGFKLMRWPNSFRASLVQVCERFFLRKKTKPLVTPHLFLEMVFSGTLL